MKKTLILAALLVAMLMPVSAWAAVCSVAEGNNVNVSWTNPPEPDLSTVQIYRGTTTEFSDALQIGEVDYTKTTYVDANVEDGVYFYFLTAKDGRWPNCELPDGSSPPVNISAPSAPSNAVLVDTTPPSPPSDVHAG